VERSHAAEGTQIESDIVILYTQFSISKIFAIVIILEQILVVNRNVNRVGVLRYLTRRKLRYILFISYNNLY